jgi:hypothetical protein
MALTQLLSRIEDTNQSEHRKTREVIKERLRKRKESEVGDKEMDSVPHPTYNSEWEKYRHAFLSRPVKTLNNANERLIGKPEALDVSQEEEQRARSLVHAKILDSLRYQAMETRYEDVEEAYPKTLDWLFDDFETPALNAV